MVDDQPINIKLLQRKLERQGLEILVAYNGRECLRLVEEQEPDLILLDVMMPEMDGIETCQHLKANPKTETIPIIFITAKASKEGKLEGLDAGAVDYITKPIDLDETLARVRTQLRLQEMYRENLYLQERLGEVRKSAAVGAITQGIAHNLNNLLGVVVGYLDLLKNGYDSPDMVRRSVGLMDHSINRMVNIIQQLGTIATHDKFERSPQQVSDLINQSVKRFKTDYQVDANIQIDYQTEDDFSIRANPENFETIVGRLLINSWESYPKETPNEDRKIQIKTELVSPRGGDKLQLSIIDHGSGIAPEVKDTLFEPFITTKTSIGRGMGLTISRHSLRNLDGDIKLSNNSTQGATAVLTHPIA